MIKPGPLFYKTIRGILAVITFGIAAMCCPTAALAQVDNHAGHDHAAETKPADASQAEQGAHGSDGDVHEGHDDEAVRFDAATLEEFGIVIEEASSGVVGDMVRLPGEVVFNADRVAHVTPSVPGIVQ